MDTNDRYVVREEAGMGGVYGYVVDTRTGEDLCPAEEHEAPEDASVYRTFEPLLAEMNRLARMVDELKARVRELERPEESAPCHFCDGPYGCQCHTR